MGCFQVYKLTRNFLLGATPLWTAAACAVAVKSPSGKPLQAQSQSGNSFEQGGHSVGFASLEIIKHSSQFPKTEDSPREYIDSLDFIAPCLTAGCSAGRRGIVGGVGHPLHWFVTQSGVNQGRGYYIKFWSPAQDSQRECWERYEWNADWISIPFDNCWTPKDMPEFGYTRYADGRWLAREWQPGGSFLADDAISAGKKSDCSEMKMYEGKKRQMTFVWRKKDFDWGPVGKLDTIAIRQSYPDEPGKSEHYFYARGYGLIAWNMEYPNDNLYHVFISDGTKVVPRGSKCEPVEKLEEATHAPVAEATTQATRPGNSVNSDSNTSGTSTTRTPSAVTDPQSSAQTNTMTNPQSTVSQSMGQTSTQTSTSVCVTDQFSGGTAFVKNVPVYNCSGKHSLVFQSDGNLVLYNTTTRQAIWFTNTGGAQAADTAVFQNDGNLVIYKNGVALWNSGTGNRAGARLQLQDDGNLVIKLNNTVYWNSNTTGR